MREIIISVQEEGQRLDRYLKKYLPGASSGFLHKMLRKKNIKRNQEKASGGEKLMAGDKIQIYFSEETLLGFGAGGTGRPEEDPAGLRKHPREPGFHAGPHKPYPQKRNSYSEKRSSNPEKQSSLRKQVKVLFQNDDVLIIHKPAGMLSQKSVSSEDSLNDWLYDYWSGEMMKDKEIPASFRPSVANRLDRNTSGIVLCGITVKGLQMLTRMLKDRRMDKYYLCMVKGRMEGKRKIYGYLIKDEKNNRVRLSQSPLPGSSPVETWYEVLGASDQVSFLKVKLVTGKSHQIRAHLASEGHPLLGDAKYGDPGLNRKLKKEGICHQMLHSYEMKIPEDTEDIPEELAGLIITDEPPEDFLRIMKKYGISQRL